MTQGAVFAVCCKVPKGDANSLSHRYAQAVIGVLSIDFASKSAENIIKVLRRNSEILDELSAIEHRDYRIPPMTHSGVYPNYRRCSSSEEPQHLNHRK